MDEKLTMAEIQERFDSEWVVLQDPEVDEHLRVIRGKVVCHGKDRDDVYKKAAALGLKSSAFLYTGRIPENTVIAI